jgi:hypothetical protein
MARTVNNRRGFHARRINSIFRNTRWDGHQNFSHVCGSFNEERDAAFRTDPCHAAFATMKISGTILGRVHSAVRVIGLDF